MGSYMFLAVFVFAILGTWWGWSRILIPFGLPVAYTGIRLVHAIIITFLCISPIMTGWWFRTYGYDFHDIAWVPLLSEEQQQQFRWKRENNINPRGDWEPNWRSNRHLKPLPQDWNGHSAHRNNPLWSILIPVGLIGGYIIVESSYRKRHGIGDKEERKKHWEQRPPPTMAALNERFNRTVAEFASNRDSFDPVVWETKPQKPAPTCRNPTDVDFVQALKNMGYKKEDVRGVMTQCTEQDLEARVRHALQILARK